jgi:hypothetical protein
MAAILTSRNALGKAALEGMLCQTIQVELVALRRVSAACSGAIAFRQVSIFAKSSAAARGGMVAARP